MMADIISAEEQEKRMKLARLALAKEIKRDLESWREVLIPLYSILLWERKWYPGLLVTLSTAAFLIFWLMEPSVLTTISITGLIITLVDYIVPTLTANICNPDNWTGVKEKKLEMISFNLAAWILNAAAYITKFFNMRQNKPALYIAGMVITLGSLAWLGNTMNNVLLTYIFVTMLILLPGMKQHGIFQKCSSEVMKTIYGSLNKVKSKIH